MGKMSELHIEVTELLEMGVEAEVIAELLDIPLEWVESVEDDLQDWESSLDEMEITDDQPV